MAKATTLLGGLLRHPPGGGATVEQGRTTTYGALVARSAAIALGLLDGRRSLAGGRIALLLPPGASFVEVLFGIWRAGGIAVPLSALQTRPELEHILSCATPEATVVTSGLAGRIDELVAVTGPDRLGRRIDVAEIHASADRRTAVPGDPLAPDIVDETPALMLFTSGTTGKPKGVCLSHAGILATLDSLAHAWRWQREDRLLHALPLYHTHGLVVALLGALWAGATADFVSFDAELIWDAFARASVFMAVPTMYVRLVDVFQAASAERRAGWSASARALRLTTSGSAALSPALASGFAHATGQTILERYGMTEIGMALSNPYDGPRLPGSVGLPLPGVTVEIVDDQDRPTADGDSGELRVRSPQLFLGYHGDRAATLASYDQLGRFRTGDTAIRASDGYIRILGRTSVDILKSGGYKLSALEIEEVLRAHPGIAEVAIIGVPDPVWGDRVTACVVPRSGATPPTIDELRAFARDMLAPYKLPRELRLMSRLPRNPMGKVQKSLLL
jgi:malonyl-CoA/methylmalonyl-CoA synthetase